MPQASPPAVRDVLPVPRVDASADPAYHAVMPNAVPSRRPLRALALLMLASLLCGGDCHWAFSSGDSDDDGDHDGGTVIIVDEATFGGWDLADELTAEPGVLSVQRGWDGDAPFLGPSLARWTGHARVLRLRYDVAATDLTRLVRAARAARAGERRLTVFVRDEAEADAARAAFPPDSLPRLRLRDVDAFRPAR